MNRLAIVILCLAFSTCAAAQDSPRYVNPDSVAHLPGLTQAIVLPAGKLIYLSGQVPTNVKGDLVGNGDFRAQAKQTFENIKAVLTAAGSSPANIVKISYYVVGLDDRKRDILREVKAGYLDTKNPPVSTLLGVERLFRADVQLEIEVVATTP